MAITNGYTTLARLKAELSITDVDDDTALEQTVEAASRLIDGWCARRFYTTAEDETRYYTAEYSDVIHVGDLLSVDSLKTWVNEVDEYNDTWETTDYDLEPYNAALDVRPYTEIHIAYGGDYRFPLTRKGVQIVGKFGFCAAADLPRQIATAALVIAERIWKRYDTPLGMSGSAEFGNTKVATEIFQDSELVALLAPFRRFV